MNTHKAISWGIVASLILLVWIPLHVFYSGLPKDFPNEPDGFGGLTWGTHIGRVRDQMEPANNEQDPQITEFFYKKDWPNRFEIFDVNETVFVFSRKYDRRLNQVWIDFPIENFEEVARYSLERWGKTPREELLGKPYYEWKGTITTITLKYDVAFPKKFGSLYFYSTDYLQKERERNKRK